MRSGSTESGRACASRRDAAVMSSTRATSLRSVEAAGRRDGGSAGLLSGNCRAAAARTGAIIRALQTQKARQRGRLIGDYSRKTAAVERADGRLRLERRRHRLPIGLLREPLGLLREGVEHRPALRDGDVGRRLFVVGVVVGRLRLLLHELWRRLLLIDRRRC